MGEVMEAQKRLEEVYAAYAEPDADFDKLAEEQGELEHHRHRRRWRQHRTNWNWPPTPAPAMGCQDRPPVRW